MEDKLQKIVNNWKIKNGAEYRGYRCAKCQKSIRKAYQYFLDSKYFKTNIHLCKVCNKSYTFQETKFKSFKCDNCSRVVFKAFHIWKIDKNKKIEKHLCKNCFASF